jgi:hypothetical protein
MVVELRIDSNAAGNADLFRLREWPIALIASERTRRLLEDAGTTGIAFEQVS